jgi:hypothetical protein
MIVAPIPMAARLVDTDEPLTPTDLAAFKDAGIDGIVAYLGGNLSSELVANANALKMGIVPVNFSHAPGWLPSADLGTADAERSVRLLAGLGVPLQGLDDWCDIEGCGGEPTAYCTSWCQTVLGDGAGRVPNEYIGEGSQLTGHQSYLLPFLGYWKGGSAGIEEPDCGWKMVQLYPLDQTLAGKRVDYDFVQRDFKERAPTWLIGS